MAIDISKLTPKQIKAYKEAGVLDQVIEGAKNDPSSGLPFQNPVYGQRPGTTDQFGIFTQPGVNPQTWDATAQPFDITNVLTPQSSIYQQERVSILTGQQDTEGTNPTDTCDTPVRPGNLKTCQQNYVFGTLYIGSQKIKLDEAGALANRAVSERVLMNRAANDPFLPEPLRNPGVDLLSPTTQALMQMSTAVRRAIAEVMITGDPANTGASAVPGFTQEFNGLDTIIKTGYVDAITGQACPAADSDVRTWGAPIESTVGGNGIAVELTDLFYGRQMVARQVGMNPQFVWVMRPELFRELTYQYATNYFINRLTAPYTTSAILETNSESVRRLQLEMLQGNYLLIDNIPVPVLFSDGIPFTAAGGNYRQSDVYLLPLSDGGVPLVNFEYFPMDNPQARTVAQRFDSQVFYTNNGMYIMTFERQKMCVEFVLSARFRMWHNAPFLAGRIDDLQYVNTIAYRNPFPGGSGYLNGGVTYYNNVN
jgi:hypothetical protein